jgi:outer membrane lipoprotein-sorting protein
MARPLVPIVGFVLFFSMPGASASRAESPLGAPVGTRESLDVARDLLTRAIAIRYDCDSGARIDLRMRDGRGGERRRSIRTLAKHIDGRMHSIGRLMAPEHLRGMTILSIENHDRGDDVFVYLPSLGRVRRISMGHRADSFLGSDLTYRDLDRQRAEDYRVESLDGEVVQGEPAHVITTRPVEDDSHQRVAFVAAESDLAILELRYYKNGGAQASRVARFPRASIRRWGENLIPTRIQVVDTIRGSETDVEISELEIDPEIDDRIFSLLTLQSQRGFHTERDARGRTPSDGR